MHDHEKIVGQIHRKTMPGKRSLVVFGIAAGFLVIISSIPSLIALMADWYWYQEIGFETVFYNRVATKLWLGLITGGLSLAFFYGNLRFAQRGVVPNPVIVGLKPDAPKLDMSLTIKRMTWPISLMMAFLVGVSASNAWLTVLRFLNRTDFGVTDPVFSREVSYYVFSLPAISGLIGMVIALSLIAIFMTFPIYAMRRDIMVVRNGITIEPSAGMHMGGLIATLFLATAANIWFVRLPALLYSETGPLFGASFTDLSVRAPALRFVAGIAVAGAVLVLIGATRRRLPRFAAIAVTLYIVGSVVGTALLPAAIQKFVVVPNELTRELNQIGYHIAATQRAWGLDRVTTRDLTGEAALSLDDVQANSATVDNVRLWDRAPLLQTFGQIQEIRTYYDFVSVDDDRYWIDGQYRQVLMSPRELNTQSLPTRTFVNERLTFTHGMGLTLSPVNQVTVEGLPVLFIKDLPPASSVSLQITRPGIYYGELSSDYVFVNTGQPEFDYPAADGSNATTVYSGLGGVPVSSLLRRLVLSARFGSKDLLFSSLITSGSRMLYHRNIAERAAMALPFLRWDSDPYIVITDEGHLKWILDAYTATNRYPYSQPLEGTNYMRNSVKVVIDAYDGTVDAYVVDPDDPLLRTYARIFEGIFQPLDSMPADIRAHIRYPEDLFRAQTELYSTYHMEEPEIFYHREDQWQIPVLARGEGQRERFLRHIIMKLPGEQSEEFIVMAPFTPRQKDNLAAWMVARSDGDRYGELVVYRFPRQSLVFGPTQIVNRMNQNTEISRQISLWDQRGSEVIRGNLLVIPIEESLIFVQALYLRAEGGRIPELKRVIVAYQNQVVMEETLGAALTRLFGGTVETDAPARVQGPVAAGAPMDQSSSTDDLATQLEQHYDAAVAAQRAGDWATYGAEIQRVGELIAELRSRQ